MPLTPFDLRSNIQNQIKPFENILAKKKCFSIRDVIFDFLQTPITSKPYEP